MLKKFGHHLHKRNVKDTTISVYMRTLRALFNRAIKILSPVQEIIDFYHSHNRNNPYIFPILEHRHDTPAKIHTRIKSGLRTYNKHLKIISEHLGFESKLTSSVSRHS